MRTQLISLPQCVEHFLRDDFSLGGRFFRLAAQAVQQHDKFIPAEARHRVAFAGATPQAGADLLQQHITNRVSIIGSDESRMRHTAAAMRSQRSRTPSESAEAAMQLSKQE